MRAKGRSAGAKAKQGKARRRDAPSRKTFPGLPTVVDVTVRMPDGQKVGMGDRNAAQCLGKALRIG